MFRDNDNNIKFGLYYLNNLDAPFIMSEESYDSSICQQYKYFKKEGEVDRVILTEFNNNNTILRFLDFNEKDKTFKASIFK